MSLIRTGLDSWCRQQSPQLRQQIWGLVQSEDAGAAILEEMAECIWSRMAAGLCGEGRTRALRNVATAGRFVDPRGICATG